MWSRNSRIPLRNQLSDDRQSLRESIAHQLNSVLQTGKSRCVVVKGEVGVGKSHLLSSLVRSSPLMVACGVASSLPSEGSNFEPWKQILSTIVLFRCSRKTSSAFSALNPEATFLLQLLDQLSSRSLAALMNPYISQNFTESDETLSMTPFERKFATLDLLERVLVELTRTEPIVITIDDAHKLGEDAWGMCGYILQRVPAILLVVALRPPIRTPFRLLELEQLANVTLLHVKPLSRKAIYEIACTSLGVSSLSNEVQEFVLDKARGNPLVRVSACAPASAVNTDTDAAAAAMCGATGV